MPPKGKGKKAPAPVRKMPPPLPHGEVLVDGINKLRWVIGASIGVGGFGEIYLAAPHGIKASKAEYVIKIEPHENGPLFSELSYYRRVAKEGLIQDWVKKMRLQYLPIPKYITSGSHEFKGVKYRFMVMQRFGTDIEKHFRIHTRFSDSTVCYLALRMLEALQFLHQSEYAHADIKGSNLLTGLGCEEDHVYLVDYGLAYRYRPEGKHKEYLADPRRAHDGTVEYTSIDAHDGVNPSRRGDLEILGYCLLQWSCGELPWEDNLKDKDYVASSKKQYKKNVSKLMKDCFGSSSSSYKFLLDYMTKVYKLNYTDTPLYSVLRKIFTDQLKGRDPKKTLEWLGKKKKGPARSPVVKVLKLSPLLEPKEKRRKVNVDVAVPLGRAMPQLSVKMNASSVNTTGSGTQSMNTVSSGSEEEDPAPTRPSLTRPSLTKPSLIRPSLTMPSLTKPSLIRPLLNRPSAIKKQKIEETDFVQPPPPGRKRKPGQSKTAMISPPTRRSKRNRGKPVNYKDLDSSYESPSSKKRRRT